MWLDKIATKSHVSAHCKHTHTRSTPTSTRLVCTIICFHLRESEAQQCDEVRTCSIMSVRAGMFVCLLQTSRSRCMSVCVRDRAYILVWVYVSAPARPGIDDATSENPDRFSLHSSAAQHPIMIGKIECIHEENYGKRVCVVCVCLWSLSTWMCASDIFARVNTAAARMGHWKALTLW